MSKNILHTKAEVLRKNIQPEEGVIDAIVGSTSVLDRMGDSINQSGWDLKNYKTNKVILWGHNVTEDRPPIGKALKVWIEGKGSKLAKLMFKVKFDLQDSFAAEIFRKVKEGFINTVSVGFIPKEWEDLDEENIFGGRKYLKQELLELSFVPVPANPEAVVALRAMGKKDKRFSPTTFKEIYPEVKEEELAEEKVEEKEEEKIEKPIDAPKETTPVKEEDKEKEEIIIEEEEVKVEEVSEVKEEDTKEEEIEKVVEEEKIEDEKELDKEEEEIDKEEIKEEEIIEEETDKEKVEEEKEPIEEVEEEVKEEEVEEEKDIKISKKIIPFKDLDTLPETEIWDGPGEMAKAEVNDLKVMCTWFDTEKADSKGSYKLPHHKAEGHKAVWRGVAASMASLLGARGGVTIPEEDRKGVYNHLKKHYIQFNKEVPEFKMVEEQILATLGEEIHALSLDREDKYITRLIKKVLKKQNETKVNEYSTKQVKKALAIIDLALSFYKTDSLKGGEK